MIDPQWVTRARLDLGLREVPGKGNAPTIVRWLATLGAWWRDDATPWCGVAVAAWMHECGIGRPKHWYRAKAWLEWGIPIAAPAVGAVVVFERQGGGHVGLVVGKDARDRLLVLGGNQADAVTIAPFDRARVVGYRWPQEWGGAFVARPLPVLAAAGPSSSDEA